MFLLYAYMHIKIILQCPSKFNWH